MSYRAGLADEPVAPERVEHLGVFGTHTLLVDSQGERRIFTGSEALSFRRRQPTRIVPCELCVVDGEVVWAWQEQWTTPRWNVRPADPRSLPSELLDDPRVVAWVLARAEGGRQA